MIEILLSPADLALGEAMGVGRTQRGTERERKLLYGVAGHDAHLDVVGVTGEIAVAIALGKLDEWDPGEELDHERGDVYGWQVRTTEWQSGGLLLHPERDDPDHRFVLVTLGGAWARICGWVFGREGMQPQFWRTDLRHSCHLVPQKALRRFLGYEMVPI